MQFSKDFFFWDTKMGKAAPLESSLNSNNYKDMKMAVIWVL